MKPNREERSWERRGYRRIASVIAAADTLEVCFEAGDCVRVDVGRLLRPGEQTTDLAGTTFTRHDLTIPIIDGEVEVSWLSVRLLTDPAFNAHWAALAADARRRTGRRLVELREQRGVGRKELARCAALPLERLVAIENGEADADYSTLDRILSPLNCTLDDLWDPMDVDVPEASAARASA